MAGLYEEFDNIVELRIINFVKRTDTLRVEKGMDMSKREAEIYSIVACEIGNITREPPLYREVDSFVRLLKSMPKDELHRLIEEERKHLQQN